MALSFVAVPVAGRSRWCSGEKPARCLTKVDANTGIAWIWRDIRIHDQPVLREAQRLENLAVLFVDDPLYTTSSRSQNLFLRDALESLSRELELRRSKLYFRSGNAAQQVAEFAAEISASTVYTSECPDFAWRQRAAELRSTFPGQLKVVEDSNLGDDRQPHPAAHYSRWSGWRSALGSRPPQPVPPPARLPPPPSNGSLSIDAGELTRSRDEPELPFESEYLADCCAEDDRANLGVEQFSAQELITEPDRCLSLLVSEKADLFRSLRSALALGCVSLPQVHRAGAREKANAKDWHRRLANSDSQRAGLGWRYWVWNGAVVRFRSEGALDNPSAPAILFVHGFGASCQQFAKNLAFFAELDFKAYALDLIGFGRTEKPATQYTQHLWEDQIAAFVREVVREPVYVVGNSIGGYMSMSFAADFYPHLCKGAVLVNSAGSIEPAPETPADVEAAARETNPWIIQISRGAIYVLQSQIRSVLVSLYPVNPEEVTKELVRDIYRDSTDPGAAWVLESGARLPKRRTLVDLFDKYGGPLLVLQGAKDPLNDAVARAKGIEGIYEEATVRLLDAGHCPHDEVPTEFNEALLEWTMHQESLA